jgi:hypothetical protein
MPEKGVRRARVTVDATMLATAIRVDRLVERKIRAVVVRDDRTGLLDPHLGRKAIERFETAPAIIGFDPCVALEPADSIACRAAPAAARAVDHFSVTCSTHTGTCSIEGHSAVAVYDKTKREQNAIKMAHTVRFSRIPLIALAFRAPIRTVSARLNGQPRRYSRPAILSMLRREQRGAPGAA